MYQLQSLETSYHVQMSNTSNLYNNFVFYLFTLFYFVLFIFFSMISFVQLNGGSMPESKTTATDYWVFAAKRIPIPWAGLVPFIHFFSLFQ